MDQRSQGSNSLKYSGVPETTLRFKNLPEGVTELGKATTLMVMVCYTKRILAKISAKGEEQRSSIPELLSMGFHLSSPYGVV